jgi:hypothetical protein
LSRKDLEMLTKYPSIKVFCQHCWINIREWNRRQLKCYECTVDREIRGTLVRTPETSL